MEEYLSKFQAMDDNMKIWKRTDESFPHGSFFKRRFGNEKIDKGVKKIKYGN